MRIKLKTSIGNYEKEYFVLCCNLSAGVSRYCLHIPCFPTPIKSPHGCHAMAQLPVDISRRVFIDDELIATCEDDRSLTVGVDDNDIMLLNRWFYVDIVLFGW